MSEFNFNKKVEQIKVKEKNISSLLQEMSRTGFQGRKLGEIVDVWIDMIKDPDVTIFFGYAASLSTTGQYEIIKWLIILLLAGGAGGTIKDMIFKSPSAPTLEVNP